MTRTELMFIEIEEYTNENGYKCCSNTDLFAILLPAEVNKFFFVRSMTAYLVEKGYRKEFEEVNFSFEDEYMIFLPD